MHDDRPPLTPEDLASLRFVTEAHISPDGAQVACVVKTVADDLERYRSAIWLVPTDGSRPPARLSPGRGLDSVARWSPDGARLAYVSDDGEEPREPGRKIAPRQVHVVEVAGGEPRRITAFEDDCTDLVWTPHGASLIFVVKDPRAPDEKKGGIRVYDRLRYRSDEGWLLDLRRTHLWSVPAAGGEPTRLTRGDWDDLQPAISPDGRRVAFVSNRTEDRDRNTVADIHLIPIGGGDSVAVTDGRGSWGNPSWSPDGERITCYGFPKAQGSAAENVHLWAFPAEPARGAGGIDLTDGWDRTVGSVVINDMRGHVQTPPPAWTADARALLFVGSDGGTANVYRVAAAGGRVEAVTTGSHQVVSATFDRGRRALAALIGTAVDPGEVYAGPVGGALRRITSFNDELLAGRFLSEPERITFKGAGGWPIEGWLLRPRGFDKAKKWPLVLEVHGGPHTAYGHAFFHEFQVLAGRGYAVLYTNPRGSHTYGDRFVKACVGDWGGKDYEDLMAGLDHVLARGWADPMRLYVTGGSYGGFMTNWIVGHTDRFRAAVTQRSISNHVSAFGTSDIGWHFWEHEMGDATPWRDAAKLVSRSPLTYVERVRTPLLLLHAERDLRCPIEQAEQFFTALKVLGREAVFVRYPEDSHELTRGGKPANRIDHCRRIATWFDAHA